VGANRLQGLTWPQWAVARRPRLRLEPARVASAKATGACRARHAWPHPFRASAAGPPNTGCSQSVDATATRRRARYERFATEHSTVGHQPLVTTEAPRLAPPSNLQLGLPELLAPGSLPKCCVVHLRSPRDQLRGPRPRDRRGPRQLHLVVMRRHQSLPPAAA
jgi:hypothetical protein